MVIKLSSFISASTTYKAIFYMQSAPSWNFFWDLNNETKYNIHEGFIQRFPKNDLNFKQQK